MNRDYYAASSIPAEYAIPDTAVLDSGIVDLVEPIDVYAPYFRSTIFLGDTYESNVGGNKGSAIYAKGISSLQILETTFTKNKAVDAIQEAQYVPAYSKYVLEIDPATVTIET